MTNSISKTDTKTITSIKPEFMWQVVLFNCNCHTFDDVIEQLMKAIGCSEFTASQYANVAHKFDSVVVFKGEKEECERVAYILEEIGLFIKVTQ